MAVISQQVNKLYKALGYSNAGRALDKPIHQNDVPVSEALNLLESCSTWFNN